MEIRSCAEGKEKKSSVKNTRPRNYSRPPRNSRLGAFVPGKGCARDAGELQPVQPLTHFRRIFRVRASRSWISQKCSLCAEAEATLLFLPLPVLGKSRTLALRINYLLPWAAEDHEPGALPIFSRSLSGKTVGARKEQREVLNSFVSHENEVAGNGAPSCF